MSKNKNTDSNRSFMCHQTRGFKKIITLGKTTYVVKAIFPITGPTIADCIETQVKIRLEKSKNEKDTHPIR